MSQGRRRDSQVGSESGEEACEQGLGVGQEVEASEPGREWDRLRKRTS